MNTSLSSLTIYLPLSKHPW